MFDLLTETESRIIACLVEKETTTPEYYPLTLNSLTAACNQKSNRDPIVSYSEETVEKTLEILRAKNMVYVFYGSTSRVPKYKHRLAQTFELGPQETAMVCVLMLRGAQTIGELRERTSRIYEFPGLNEVNETLESLLKRDDDEPLIIKLERQPGQKEARYAHLLCGNEFAENSQPVAKESRAAQSAADAERLIKLEQEIETLRTDLTTFKAEFEEFKKQFD
jgi:uncharacterized protein